MCHYANKSDYENLSKDEMLELICDLKIKEEKLEKFISNISHDLRSPLNVIMSIYQMLESIKDENVETKEKEYLEMLKRNSYKMLKLIDNLIDVTRLEKNFFSIKKKNIEIVNFMENTIASIDKYAKQKDMTLVFDTNKEECITAIDPEAFDRIFINLLSNAIKFSKSGDCIYVTLMIDDINIKVSVVDNGVGISTEDQKSIFNRFTQAMKTKTEYKGSGIGLDLVKSLVELHDGYITLKSEVSKGSDFTVVIPRSKLEKEEEKIDETSNNVQLLEIEFSDIYL
ncbi:MAG: HAMP domain-containing sensor histidine kinase [Terrisporobacter sp.]|uniref:sensor histidine kinase n=1 Tax=Clostridia TaxID=186801 RepID=UPI002FCAA976